jgi:toxin-antitoxin system PIN domain toxin
MFVDTNILVYATQITSPHRDAARTALQHYSNGGARLRLSRQILREYLAVVTRPQLFASPITMAEALADIERFAAAFELLEDGPEVGVRLVQLCRSVALAGRQVHDANIVATMLAHDETRLLTANRGDFQRFAPAIEIVGL